MFYEDKMKPLISLILILSCNYSLALHDMLETVQANITGTIRDMKCKMQNKHERYLFDKNINKTDFSKEYAKQNKDIKTANSHIRHFLEQLDSQRCEKIPELFSPNCDKQSLLVQLNTFRDNTDYSSMYINPLFFENVDMQCVKSGELYFCILTNYLNGRLSPEETQNRIQQLLHDDAIQNPPVSGPVLIDRWEKAGRFLSNYLTPEALMDLRGNIELTGDLEYDKIVNYFIWWNITHFPTSNTHQGLVNTRKVALAANELWDNIFYYFNIKYRVYEDIVTTNNLCQMTNMLLWRYIYTKISYSDYDLEACKNMFQSTDYVCLEIYAVDLDFEDINEMSIMDSRILQHIDEIPALLPPSIL